MRDRELVQVTRNERIRVLRGQGKHYHEIAVELGVSTSTAFRVCNSASVAATQRRRQAAKNAWAREHYRGSCYCGAQTSHPLNKRCRPCANAYRDEVYALVLDVVQAMYEEGWPVKEISAAFGHKTVQGCEPWLSILTKAGRITRRRPRRNA